MYCNMEHIPRQMYSRVLHDRALATVIEYSMDVSLVSLSNLCQSLYCHGGLSSSRMNFRLSIQINSSICN